MRQSVTTDLNVTVRGVKEPRFFNAVTDVTALQAGLSGEGTS
jgi:hypothetical protein